MERTTANICALMKALCIMCVILFLFDIYQMFFSEADVVYADGWFTVLVAWFFGRKIFKTCKETGTVELKYVEYAYSGVLLSAVAFVLSMVLLMVTGEPILSVASGAPFLVMTAFQIIAFVFGVGLLQNGYELYKCSDTFEGKGSFIRRHIIPPVLKMFGISLLLTFVGSFMKLVLIGFFIFFVTGEKCQSLYYNSKAKKSEADNTAE